MIAEGEGIVYFAYGSNMHTLRLALEDAGLLSKDRLLAGGFPPMDGSEEGL
ncbi:hypothetical protein V5F72_10690 [Xanthobacter flavus]|uniref:hypothetical protein n=1 Tax=Xanthobacter flavus TaxID=281 RepID=UPI00372A31BD